MGICDERGFLGRIYQEPRDRWRGCTRRGPPDSRHGDRRQREQRGGCLPHSEGYRRGLPDGCGRVDCGWEDGRLERALQRQTHGADVRDALAKWLAQAQAQRLADMSRHCDRQRCPRGFLVDHVREGLGDVFATERPLPRQHLEQHAPEGPNIGAPINGLAARG